MEDVKAYILALKHFQIPSVKYNDPEESIGILFLFV